MCAFYIYFLNIPRLDFSSYFFYLFDFVRERRESSEQAYSNTFFWIRGSSTAAVDHLNSSIVVLGLSLSVSCSVPFGIFVSFSSFFTSERIWEGVLYEFRDLSRHDKDHWAFGWTGCPRAFSGEYRTCTLSLLILYMYISHLCKF